MAAPTSAPQTTGDDKSVGADASSVPHIDRFFGSSVDMEIDAIIARATASGSDDLDHKPRSG